MNQKTLLIVVVAVVAVVVVIGLWASGALQTGPLAGSIGETCVPTTITSDCYSGMFRAVVWGTLKSSSGTPLPNQHLILLQAYQFDDSGNPVAWEAWKETDTGSDGKFGTIEGEAVYYRPKVVYNGGSYNGVSYCNTSVVCHEVASVPLKW